PEHPLPAHRKDPGGFLPTQASGPLAQEKNHRLSTRLFAHTPGHRFGDDPAVGTINAAGPVMQPHGNLPQGHKLPCPQGKTIVAGSGFLALAATAMPAFVNRLEKVLRIWENKKRFLPQSGMGKAIAYTLKRMKTLRVFLHHGEVEIDNNLVENAIRPTAVGKKNWLFFGTELSGQKAAVLYTIIESCRRHQIDPESYLRHVLTVLPTATTSQIKDLTPAAIARSGILPRIGKPSRQPRSRRMSEFSGSETKAA
ncbi:MAG: transposase, partial [Verrucomicrobiae bacterium]|nr:transposase [Verrucomicrobiae bacterium]